MSHNVTLIPGDGIGPEVVKATRRVVDATGVDIHWREVAAGEQVIESCGDPLPESVLDAIREDGIALKGPITTPVGKGFRSVNVRLRQSLNLYANYRPAKSLPGVVCRCKETDLIVIRENTEGLYSGLEHTVVPGVVESLRIITRDASERIIRFAFEKAMALGRKKVTCVHKANILKLSDGLFLDTFREVAKDYPDMESDDRIVDATAMLLVMDPSKFDVLVMENLFGDIVSDLASGLIGGLGAAPSGNIGSDIAVFEAVHGSAPDIAGKGIANPTALMLSAVMMLEHMGEGEASRAMDAAIRKTLEEGKCVTGDFGGKATTQEYADAVIANL